MRVQECNWLQAVEGEIDSAHAPLLHGRLDAQGTTSAWIQKRDLRPTFECIKQDFGMSIAARRNYDANTLYWRVNQFILPFYTLVPPLSPFPDLSGHAWVPIDDENTLCIMFSYHPSQPLLPKTRQIFEEGHNGRESGHASRHSLVQHPVTVPYAGYWTKYNPQNGFQFDYEAQQTTWFSGLPGLWVQDGACQSGVSPIFDRTKENLCSSDTGIAMTRRLLLETLGAYRDHGTRPKGVTDPDVFMVRAVSLRLPPEDSLGRRRRALHARAARRRFRVRAVTDELTARCRSASSGSAMRPRASIRTNWWRRRAAISRRSPPAVTSTCICRTA